MSCSDCIAFKSRSFRRHICWLLITLWSDIVDLLFCRYFNGDFPNVDPVIIVLVILISSIMHFVFAVGH